MKNKYTRLLQVEAYQVGGDESQPDWFKQYLKERRIQIAPKGVYIRSSELLEYVPDGDYIIYDKHDGIYSCQQDKFEEIFEVVNNEI